jgi:peptide/nickel transport system substrate-binding protein
VQGAQELDPQKRTAIYHRWQQIVAEQQPLTFLVTPTQISAMRTGFGNVKPSSLGGMTWNLEEIFRSPQATASAAP